MDIVKQKELLDEKGTAIGSAHEQLYIMTFIHNLFKNRKMKHRQLRAFGVSENETGYSYSVGLMEGQFKLTATITKAGIVSAEIIDNLTGEPYVLHRISGAKGAFVGKVQEEYKSVLTAIADTCFEPDVFRSEDAKGVIRYVKEKYGDEPQFLWKRFSNNAVFRRRDNAKWYAALLIIPEKKLGIDKDGTVDIIDLRARPEVVEALVDNRKYFPGYHMNKRHWFTICLNGSVPMEKIFHYIDESYALADKR